ncbi:TIGR03032 family protein [Nostoc sp. CHAB 5834]|nr:TIGR03032 family protein [Nostoc sp. CHAB 5834]
MRDICVVVRIVGISQARHNLTFSGLPLDEKLQQKNVEPQCGLLVIDLRSGDILHSLRMEGAVLELYDVVALSGVRLPMAIGFKSDEIRRMVSKRKRGRGQGAEGKTGTEKLSGLRPV